MNKTKVKNTNIKTIKTANTKTSTASYKETFEKVFNRTIGKRKTPYRLNDIMNSLQKNNVNISERTVQRYMQEKLKSRLVKRTGHNYTNAE